MRDELEEMQANQLWRGSSNKCELAQHHLAFCRKECLYGVKSCYKVYALAEHASLTPSHTHTLTNTHRVCVHAPPPCYPGIKAAYDAAHRAVLPWWTWGRMVVALRRRQTF
jgi:hypothetical protein